MSKESPNRLLVEAWLRFASMSEQEHSDGIPHEEFQFWEELHSLIRDDPAAAWRIIANLATQLSSDQSRAYIAAGPFEELLVELGDGAKEFFEENENHALELLLPFVWTNGLTSDTQRWIKQLRRP